MNLCKIPPNLSFLHTISEFILNKFNGQEIGNTLKVILPNGFACNELQKILLQKQKIAILPEIIPFAAIKAEGKYVFDSSFKQIEPITILEEKLILSEIISNYPKLEFSILQSLESSLPLRKLFHDLIYNSSSITILKNYHTSKHWQVTYEFLIYAFEEWQKKITQLNKQSLAHSQIAAIEAELKRIRDTNANVIVAGIFDDNKIVKKFLRDLSAIPSVYIIHCMDIGSLTQNYINNQDILSMGAASYIEFEDVYHEAEYISQICKNNSKKKIAIITDNNRVKDIYGDFLLKYSVVFQDTLGMNLVNSNVAQMLIAISEILCNEFSLSKLFLLLKNPLINSPMTQKLELILRGKNRFVSSWDQIINILEVKEELELLKYYKKLIHILYTGKQKEFNLILKDIVKIAETLYSNIWHEVGALELSNFLVDLMKLDRNFLLKNIKDFPKIFYSLIFNVLYFPNNLPANVIIGKAEDLVLIKFDLVFLPQFNGNSWPPPAPNSWLSQSAQEKLGFTSERNYRQKSLYYFYLYLHNPEVIISRSKKYEGKATLTSNFLLKLQSIIGEKLHYIFAKNNRFNEQKRATFKSFNHKGAYSNFFPNTLSITDVETLIRSPYSFYAKKILSLRKYDNLWIEPKISEFGSFIHKLFDQYSKAYNGIKEKKAEQFLNIGNNLLADIFLPSYTKKIWQTKLIPLSESFVLFDEERRNNCKYIYSELKGELLLDISEHKLKITGIADRIEIDKLGHVTILDYKTGSLPSKKDIESGLSPQLIIMALMMLENGFDIKTSIVTHSVSLMYIKISSSKPYIQTTKIEFSREELKQHKSGLISLLEYYVTNKYFSYDIDLLAFNDYAHLARRNK